MKFASLFSSLKLIDEEAIVFSFPPVPRYANPWEIPEAVRELVKSTTVVVAPDGKG